MDMDTAPPAVDPRLLRRTLGRFCTGVSVVTYVVDGEPRGVTVNSFTSVSMSPPLILVSIGNSARTRKALMGNSFAVNVLGSQQHDMAMTFAGQGTSPTAVGWDVDDVSQAPRLKDTAAWISCRAWEAVPAGDHVLFIGEVVGHGQSAVEPLTFLDGGFRLPGPALPV